MTTEPLYRSGAVARMVGMPVTTLRVWERRYGLGSEAQSRSGHRLYTNADVQRIALLKRLTQLGHAIGSIAHLGQDALQQVGSTHATTRARVGSVVAETAARAAIQAAAAPSAAPGVPSAAPQAPGVVVVGAGLGHRLQRVLHGEPRLGWIAASEDLAMSRAERGRRQPDGPAGLLLVAAPSLGTPALAQLESLAAHWGAARIGVCYSFATQIERSAHEAAGVRLLREPCDDQTLREWVLDALPAPQAMPAPVAVAPLPSPPPRRYDDVALADFAALSSTIACECPRHVAELLMQLSHFEAYSAGCANRDPADAAMHRHLQQVAGTARALFEDALERLAIHEGLLQPE